MSDNKIENMGVKQLRSEVQLLRDELAVFKRKYEDAIYNIDSDNFSSQLTAEQDNMKAQIKVASDSIKLMVSEETLQDALKNYSTVEMTKDSITSIVNAEYINTRIGDTYVTDAKLTSELKLSADGVLTSVSKSYQTKASAASDYSSLDGRLNEAGDSIVELQGSIEVNADEISAILRGNYTEDLLSGYLTGIVIEPDKIKMIEGGVYSVYNSDGLRFYDPDDQIEGWSIEPDSAYGGVLNYYVNGGNCYRMGTGESGDGYVYTDLSIKAMNSQRGRFVVDVGESSNQEVKFVGLNEATDDAPYIYANEKLLATQDWVLANAGGGGSTVAKFG